MLLLLKGQEERKGEKTKKKEKKGVGGGGDGRLKLLWLAMNDKHKASSQNRKCFAQEIPVHPSRRRAVIVRNARLQVRKGVFNSRP